MESPTLDTGGDASALFAAHAERAPRAPPRAATAGGQRLCSASSATAIDAATRKSIRGSGTVTV